VLWCGTSVNQRQEALTSFVVRDADIRGVKKSNNDPRVSRIAVNKLASVQLAAAAADTNGDSDPFVLVRLETLKKSWLPRDILEPIDDERMPNRFDANPFQKLKIGIALATTLSRHTERCIISNSAASMLVVIALNIMYFASIYREANVNQVSAPSSPVPAVFPYALRCNRIQRPPNKRVTLSLRFKIE
jgi:hypothetical protein